jgi:hypothetical protein
MNEKSPTVYAGVDVAKAILKTRHREEDQARARHAGQFVRI